MILAILGGGYVTLGSTEVRQSARHSYRVQAYYLARSGAEIARDWLADKGYLDGTEKPNEVVFLEGSLENEKDGLTLVEDKNDLHGNEPIEVRIEFSPSNIVVRSRGRYSGIAGTMHDVVELVFDAKGSFGPFDHALFALDQGSKADPAIEVGGSGQVVGPLGTNSTGAESVRFGPSQQVTVDGDLSIGSGANPEDVITVQGNRSIDDVLMGTHNVLNLPEGGRSYPDPIFPGFPEVPFRGNFDTSSDAAYFEIAADGRYDTISVREARSLTIDVGNGTRRIRVRDLNISEGQVKLINTGEDGNVILYVEDSFNLAGGSQLNLGGDFAQVTVYYKGDADLSIAGNTRFVGTLHLESAGLSVAGSSEIDGPIISSGSRDISVTGSADTHARILYAPKARVSVDGSGSILGSVIARSSAINGSAAIVYEVPDVAAVPEGIFPSGWYTGVSGAGAGGYQLSRWL